VYGEGISREGDLIDLGVEKGVLEKSGTWISFGGERMGQGARMRGFFLKENKDIRDKLENMLRKRLEIPMPGNSNAGAKWFEWAGAGGGEAAYEGFRSDGGSGGFQGEAGAVMGSTLSQIRPEGHDVLGPCFCVPSMFDSLG